MSNKELQAVINEVSRKHKFHALILYGSHARGDSSPESDYDLIAIRSGTGKPVHDARTWRGIYLDVFIYPEKIATPANLMRIRGGKVLIDRKGYGARLLRLLERRYARGPSELSIGEMAVRKVWARKMLDRIRRGDPEGNYRRAWLLTTLLEDYFAFRKQWYEGPKASFNLMLSSDPAVHSLFQRALKPNAKIVCIEKLVAAVIHPKA